MTVSGGGLSRVFQVDPNVTASISGVTITGGNVAAFYGSAFYGSGGGLYNLGTTTLTDCSPQRQFRHLGGGLRNGYGAEITLTNCTISGNSANSLIGGLGGGMAGDAHSQATLINCIITNNTAPGGSGGALGFIGYSNSPTLHTGRAARSAATPPWETGGRCSRLVVMFH